MTVEFDIGALNGTQTFEDFVGNADELDLYRFSLGAVSEVALTLNGLNDDADVAIYIDKDANDDIDSNELIIESDLGGTDEDSIIRTLGAGTYLIAVAPKGFLFSDLKQDTRYTLTVAAQSTGIGDLAGNTSSAAFNLGIANGFKTVRDFVGNADGEDYYRLSVNEVKDLSIFLNGMNDNADVFLYLDRNSDGELGSDELIVQSDRGGTDEDAIIRTLGPGTYFVRVRPSGFLFSDLKQDTLYNLSLFTPLSGSTLIADLNLLNFFGNLVGTAGVGAAGDEFFDLSSTDDGTQLEAGLTEQFRGGVRAFDGDDAIVGSESSDIVNGNQGADILRGGAGADFLRGGRDNDQIFGDDGDDLLNGNIGNDNVDGGTGNDYLRGGQDNDVLILHSALQCVVRNIPLIFLNSIALKKR